MFKFTFIATLLLTLLSPAWSATSNPYIGFAPSIQNTGGYNGLLANFFAGYQTTFGEHQSYYFAGEVFADTGSLPLSQNHFRRTNYGFGASVLPGIVFDLKTILFIRLGVESFRYSANLNTFTGGQIGLGLQTALSDTWDVRGEFVYTARAIYYDIGSTRFRFFRLGFVYNIR